MTDDVQECSWCGAELGVDGEKIFPNREGELFCSKNHRSSSNRAKKRLLDRVPNPGRKST